MSSIVENTHIMPPPMPRSMIPTRTTPKPLSGAARAMPAALIFSTVFYVSLLFTFNDSFGGGQADPLAAAIEKAGE